MQRTRQLRGLFTSRYGKSSHDLLVGNSLGGQIVQALAEQHPKQYDGALALCGVVGGTQLQLDYIGQIRTVFDFLYPGVLPGNTVQTPPITSAELNAKVIGPAYAALTSDARGPFFGYGVIARIDQTALAGRNDAERIQTLLNVLGYQALGANDVYERARNQSTFDNTGTTYTSVDPRLAPLLGLMNATITRYDAGPKAERWMERNYEPTGDLQIPMLTVHKDNDRLVPYRHEAAYLRAVTAAGATAMLRQRTVSDYGHCEFPVASMVSSVEELAAWVRSGTPPTV
jgi:pimeloyl-ACP methyl ester carboxylesterase